MRQLDGYFRHDVLKLLDKTEDCVGIELGVAAGEFSKRMVDSGRFSQVFGVDVYADNHDIGQYKDALRHVGLMRPYKLLRMTFDQAYDLFDDGTFDFIYIDGFAHSGQEGGDTIYKWARKVRVGGVIAGDDYHSDWPLVQNAVNRFAEDAGFELCVTTETEPDVKYSDYPSWAVVKSHEFAADAPSEMVAEGKAAAAAVARKRATEQRIAGRIRAIVGEERFNRLREWNRARRAGRKSG
ncbi:MAG: class I SAM-dependent methyltransferase [Silicimonas sp.]|nr:class I SAM-dependent methyltransferase [Silicimonas sp.]